MPAHAAIRLISQRPAGERLEVQAQLACGCVVTREVPADRVLQREDGTPFLVGKYPCPQGHAVTRSGA